LPSLVEEEQDDENGVNEERKEDRALQPATLRPLHPLDEILEVGGVRDVRRAAERRSGFGFFFLDAEHSTL
jgi:hypothetical protein